jgi:uncharacterized membrane protein
LYYKFCQLIKEIPEFGRMRLMQKAFLIVGLFLASFGGAYAQELHQDLQGVWRAQVLEVEDQRVVIVPGTDVENRVQTLKVLILEGERQGEEVRFENDYIQLKKGDRFYLNYLITIGGVELYSVREVDRRFAMAMVALIFVATILLFGGMQGFRALLSLSGSLFVIIYVLVPNLVKGYSPIPLSILVAGAVLFFAIFFTHGFNRRSAIAFMGTIIAVGLTGLLAVFSINLTSLTGFSSDESIYLNLNTGGQLNFVGLLLAGIIIGALGVLDDIAITQVAVVREIYGAGKNLTQWQVYKRAIRVGKEHVGALVNTLVFAYTGAALPLLLLFSLSDSSMLSIINREVFATEIIRSLIGSIGLVLCVPITTLLAAFLLHKHPDTELDDQA